MVRNATANKARSLGAGDVAMLVSAVEALTTSDENINNEEVRGGGLAMWAGNVYPGPILLWPYSSDKGQPAGCGG